MLNVSGIGNHVLPETPARAKLGWSYSGLQRHRTSVRNAEHMIFTYKLMLRSNVALLSFAAPSTAGFVGIGLNSGAAWMPLVVRRAGSPLYRQEAKLRSAD